MRVWKYFLVLLSVLLFTTCDIRDNEFDPQKRFTKIYNTPQLADSFYPVDMRQTSDGGFIVLAIYGIDQPYLLKVDQFGEKEWDYYVESPYVFPVPNLLEVGGKFYFFCMTDNGLSQANLLEVNFSTQSFNQVAQYDLTYPLAASVTPDEGILMHCYEAEQTETKVVKFSAGLNEEWSVDFPIFEDLEFPAIYEHFNRISTPQPFFNGTIVNENDAAQYYYFNGFSNYNLDLNFISATGAPLSYIRGERYDAGLSSFLQVEDSTYMLSRYDRLGKNFYNPNIVLSAEEIVSAGTLGGEETREIHNKSVVKAELIKTDSVNYAVFAANSRSGKILLKFYETEEGTLQGIRELGYNQYFSASNFIRTSDNGLAILAITAVEGRVDRLVIIKLSEDDVKDIVRDKSLEED